MNDLAPVALFVFNRPQHTRQTVEALRRNPPAADSELFVFCDGPRNEDDRARQAEIREYLATVSGFKKLEIEEHETNLGLAKSIVTGVTRISEEYGKVIVLEDDLVCSPHFLSFMNQGLTIYQHEERVAAVHGYVLPINRGRPDPFFLRFVDCWGWGTWPRAWRLFEPDGATLLHRIHALNLETVFNVDDSFDYTVMLEKQVSGEIDSWAIRWYASILLTGMLGLFPGESLIRHIGWDEGTHHAESGSAMNSPLSSEAIQLGQLDLCEDKEARSQLTAFFRSLKPGFFSRVRCRLRRLLRTTEEIKVGPGEAR